MDLFSLLTDFHKGELDVGRVKSCCDYTGAKRA
jgi:hypothetical protein